MTFNSKNPLGQPTDYPTQYDPSQLFPIERNIGRTKIGLGDIATADLPFQGYDVWNCYEVSWLSPSGKPEVRIVTFMIPFASPRLVESKSVKIYLNSFNNTKFENEQQVATTIKKDIEEAVGAEIILKIESLAESNPIIKKTHGVSIDNLELKMDEYKVDPDLISLDKSNEYVSEELHSDLLRSNCLVTGQPDWASVSIKYEDLNDHDHLRKCPALQTIVGRLEDMASSSTLCRFENQSDRKLILATHKLILDKFIASHKTPPKELILDLILDFDATDDQIHGNQENRFYHGYYKHDCFLPLYVFCGKDLLVSYLRSSKQDQAKHSWAILALLVKKLRAVWPEVRIYPLQMKNTDFIMSENYH